MLNRTKVVTCAAALIISISTGATLAAEIKIGGTGAAQGVATRLSEAYSAAYPADTVEIIPSMGSSGGIQAVAVGALHVSFSGRPMKPEEKQKGLQETPFVDTPYTFVSSHGSAQKLTTAEVVAIYSGTMVKWPDGKDISPILRPKGDSDTGYLVEAIPGMGSALEKLRQRSDVPIAGTDQDNIEAAQKTPNSFTGVTLMQVLTETPRVKLVTLDGMKASVKGMESGEYPLKRRLYVVVKAEATEEARRFSTFLRSPEAEAIIRDSGAVVAHNRTAAAE